LNEWYDCVLVKGSSKKAHFKETQRLSLRSTKRLKPTKSTYDSRQLLTPWKQKFFIHWKAHWKQLLFKEWKARLSKGSFSCFFTLKAAFQVLESTKKAFRSAFYRWQKSRCTPACLSGGTKFCVALFICRQPHSHPTLTRPTHLSVIKGELKSFTDTIKVVGTRIYIV